MTNETSLSAEMADPVKVKQFYDQTGVSEDIAVCYLQEYNWDWDLAVSAFVASNAVLPPPSDFIQPPPETSTTDNTPPVTSIVTDSNPISTEEIDVALRSFFAKAPRADVEIAQYFLARSNWNVEQAVRYWKEEGRPKASQSKLNSLWESSEYFDPMFGPLDEASALAMMTVDDVVRIKNKISPLQDADQEQGRSSGSVDVVINEAGEGGHTNVADELSVSLDMVTLHDVAGHIQWQGGLISPLQEVEQEQGSSSSVSVEDEINEAGEGGDFSPVSYRLNITNGLESDIVRRARWPDKKLWVEEISEECGVCRAKALVYLEGFQWEFDVAKKACRNKDPLPLKSTSPPDLGEFLWDYEDDVEEEACPNKTLPTVNATSSPGGLVSQESTIAAAPIESQNAPGSSEDPSQRDDNRENHCKED